LFGQKKHLFEGGIRVPAIIRWPNVIEPGVSDLPNSNLDVLPTIADIVGIDLPQDRAIDGTSILPHLLNREEIQRDKPLYWQTELDPIWMIEGVGYERRFDGEKPVDIPTPRVVIRRDDYVLRGFSSNSEDFAEPDIFQLYNVVKDKMEMVELSKFEPELFEKMRSELIEMWRDVNKDKDQTRSEIDNKTDQRN
ncbi:MAG: sulfatase/phosphatase domain-containing protein, partial [Cyclobacteriaceae bacterium]